MPGTTSPSFIQIPGNITQQFMPFVIDPKAKIHEPASMLGTKGSTGLINASPQFFSYKTYDKNYAKGGSARLQFYPSSIDDLSIQDDISFKLLYARSNLYAPSQSSITMKDVLNSIPGVQIREFLPDTRLDQCINLFVDLISNMTKLFSSDDKKGNSSQNKDQKQTEAEEASKWVKLKNVLWYTFKYMIGASSPDLYDDLSFGTMVDLPFSSYKAEVYQNNVKYPGSFVMAFPFTLYYLLQSCVTTNIYEIPAVQTNKNILYGNGYAGWTSGGDDLMSSGGFRVSSLLSKIPVIGNIANMILGNIGINYMPWWNAQAGTTTKEPEVELKFDLFNDSAEAAWQNFVFVNTVVPNNRWVQYNMFQHSSHIYDVKIEGINRLYACAGDISVSYEGVLRDPPFKWIKDLVNAHTNECMNREAFLQNIMNNRMIKIPDVYRVTMKFQSLLPANFNNYIFSYAENANHMTKYSDHAYQSSAAATMLPNAMAAFGARVAAAWKSNADNAEAVEAEAANAVIPKITLQGEKI